MLPDWRLCICLSERELGSWFNTDIILSILAIFLRAAKTGRYEEALIYLEERNNGTFNNFEFENCSLGGLLKDEYYCDIYGKRLRKPERYVNYQYIYKNWGKIEIILNA